MTPIILIKVMRVYDGILRYEARDSSEAEILPLLESGYDFPGRTCRIFVLPIHCDITKERALDIATEWSVSRYVTQVDWKEYSQLQTLMNGGLRRNQQYNRRKFKPKKAKRDRSSLDLSSESE